MNEQTQKALEELREFTLKADPKDRHATQAQSRTEKALTWKDIALGVYVGGMALAATSMLSWLIFAGLFIASVNGK